MDPIIGRKTWRTVEPWHAAVYFAPEAAEEFVALGSTSAGTYFASRVAPMGAVEPEVAVATFFNFEPGYVRASMAGAWELATPAQWLAARERAVDRLIRRLAPDAVGSAEVAWAAESLRRAALVACERPEGRPLFSGHVELDWPAEPHLVLFHAQTLLREFRGDGHIAALTVDGLDGCEALVTHAASGDVTAAGLRSSRRWSEEAWAEAEERLRSRGWLDASGSFTDEGRARREWIEARTDELAAAPYAAIGEEDCARIREVLRPFSRQLAVVFA